MSEHPSPDSTRLDSHEVEDSGHRLWTEFAQADTVEAFCRSWLAIQCRQIEGVKGGVVLARTSEPETSYVPVAVWPDVQRSMAHLSAAAEQALTKRSGVLLPAGGDGAAAARFDVAYPVQVGAQVMAVAVLEVGPQPQAQLQDALRRLHWGIAWLIDLFRRVDAEHERELHERIKTVLDLVAITLEAGGFQNAATTAATEIATHMRCDRVAIGFMQGSHIRVHALSHSAHFKRESNLMRHIAAAMDEAVDQEAAVVYPSIPGAASSTVIRAAKELCEGHGIDTFACIPFSVHGRWAGALTLERSGGGHFSQAQIETCQAAAALVGPVLEAARVNDRSVPARAWDSTRALLERLLGTGHLAWKVGAVAVLGAVGFLSLATGTHRVTADAATGASIQTAIVAPFAGYVADAAARAGDLIGEGELIALLDDRDLRLERLQWASQRDQIDRQLREAKADRDMAQIRILEAQLGQAEAQLGLVTEQLQRTRIVAPYEGILISGDLSQSLGAPVERGEVLFEIAPLDSYRVVLQVDDRDISHVAVGQSGTLTLAALPDRSFPFDVVRVTPVASAEQGRNFFRVEAQLTQATARVRPGMNGVAKIEIGERRLIWIWTHRLIEWFKLWSWTWLP